MNPQPQPPIAEPTATQATAQAASPRRGTTRRARMGGPHFLFRGGAVTVPATDLQPTGYEVAKRAFDICLAAAMLAVCAVPLMLLAGLIKLTSRGPAFYRQERIGLHGQPFWLFKLRTMRLDAESNTGPVWACPNDPRRTWLGSWLRRLSIDELPQLLNVLRGEMSLVGPRPERPFFVEKFAEELPDYHRRHDVLPGLTGWAQVRGWRGDTSIAARVHCDLEYIERRSFGFDLYVLLATPFKLFSDQNAY